MILNTDAKETVKNLEKHPLHNKKIGSQLIQTFVSEDESKESRQHKRRLSSQKIDHYGRSKQVHPPSAKSNQQRKDESRKKQYSLKQQPSHLNFQSMDQYRHIQNSDSRRLKSLSSQQNDFEQTLKQNKIKIISNTPSKQNLLNKHTSNQPMNRYLVNQQNYIQSMAAQKRIYVD